MSGDRREETCPDCLAGPHNMDARIISSRQDATGEYYAVVTWHTRDCPAYTVEQILTEEGVRRAKLNEERGQREFPPAYERLIHAVARSKFDEAAMPFVEALVELAEVQMEDRAILRETWVDVLNKHFPPPGGEPTA